MKKSILFLSAAALLAVSCQNFKKGDGGLEYNIVKDAGSDKAIAGDFLSVDMTIKSDRNDSLLNSTYDLGLPQIVQIAGDSIPGGYKGDYNSMFRFLGEGDSAVFKLNLDTMAARTGQPKPEFADKFVTFTVKVRKHFKKGQLTDSALYGQLDTYFKGELEGLQKAEAGKITKYVADNKLEPKKTASGLQYVVTEEGKGNKPALGDTVVVNYTGKLTNGTVFDSSIKAEAEKAKLAMDPMRTFEPLRFSLGNQPVIQGWTEGLQLLTKGTKATFIIPSALAYGDRPAGQKIPPYAPLVFEVELVDVIKGQGIAAPAPAPGEIPAN
ncbi:FKBP-type peptidyl-prolyl cis-trans isomerase [Sphingobacterium rhinopitheci]|uniref:FKBP-type peptidyl-prolyl cis-trans isomerase n=1 Tax=Sphingobacterium rhinopitheci TaxID=2781960 RepID=UPI001F528A55|nr:FKBP-type peptidyl-prolyl cis-trans isomerase [Sphingobacterium rhinopitheci]MCI0920307.1 FKBP-type peptidyl-prolyl cis-trans isomerase [Sphingobacterium rhinopitheci]